MLYPHLHNNFHEIGFLISSVRGGSYIGIFLLSILVSYLIPLPEAVALLIFGFVAKTTGLNVGVVFLVSFAGIVAGDNLLYRLSYFGNKYVERWSRKMRENKLIKYEYLVKDNIGPAIYFLRFVTGVRFLGPVVSGTLGIRWRKFSLHNALATALHTAIFIGLGWAYHRRIFALIIEVEVVKNILLFFSAVIVGILITVFSKKACCEKEGE